MYWLYRMKQYSTLTSTAGVCGLHEISSLSGRRGPGERSMSPISFPRRSVGSNCPRSRSRISSTFLMGYVSPRSRHGRSHILERGLTVGGTFPSWSNKLRTQSRSSTTPIPIPQESLYSIDPLHMKAMQRMHSISTI
jgi:hypothetical protein